MTTVLGHDNIKRGRCGVPVGEVPMNDHACGVWPGLEISGPSIEAIARFQQFDMKEPALDERPGEEARPAADLANAIAAMPPEQFEQLDRNLEVMAPEIARKIGTTIGAQ